MSVPLYLRTQPVGGDPQRPSDAALMPLAACDRILFLVHGYNNNEAAASEAFIGFEGLQRELIGAGASDYAQGWQVVRVYWAGDADWGITSPLFYMGAIGNARKTGEILAEVITRLGGRAGGGAGKLYEVAFVAHSLGCRVVLEALRGMRAESAHARVRRISFFAAAVPTFKLEQGNSGGLGWAAEGIEDEWLSLFSEGDNVLGSTFPLGQTLASGDEGSLPWALGFRLWAPVPSAAVLLQAENRGAGHSDYWGWKPKTREHNGRFAAYMARQSLRLEPQARDRSIETRATVVRAGEAREMIAREQRERMESPLLYGG